MINRKLGEIRRGHTEETSHKTDADLRLPPYWDPGEGMSQTYGILRLATEV